MKNTYIQDKLLEKHICRFNDGECKCDCYIAGMTDYHNHIVEKIKNAPNDMVINDKKYNNPREYTLAILQDTNLTNQ